jgi:hypothetical protein
LGIPFVFRALVMSAADRRGMHLVWPRRWYGVESSALQSLFGRKPEGSAERRARQRWRAPESQPLRLGSDNPLQTSLRPNAMTAGFGLLALLGVGVLAAIIVDQTASSQAEAGPQAIAQPAPKPVEAKVSAKVESPKPVPQAAKQKIPAAEQLKAPAAKQAEAQVSKPKPQMAAPAPKPVAQQDVAVIPHDDPRWARAAASNAAGIAAMNKHVVPAAESTTMAFAETTSQIDGTILQIEGEKVPVPADKPVGDPVVTAAVAGGAIKRPVPVPNDPQAAAAGDDAKATASRQARVRTAVNMRSRPADEASVITVVPANATVALVGCKSWCEIVFNNRRGFVYKGFVR